MTLRIIEQAGEQESVIGLHGWFSAAEVDEVEKLVAARNCPLGIDLAHLTGADAKGLRALRGLQRRGVRLTGASPYVQLLLERTTLPDGDQDR